MTEFDTYQDKNWVTADLVFQLSPAGINSFSKCKQASGLAPSLY
jgi:hypothetical protein